MSDTMVTESVYLIALPLSWEQHEKLSNFGSYADDIQPAMLLKISSVKAKGTKETKTPSLDSDLTLDKHSVDKIRQEVCDKDDNNTNQERTPSYSDLPFDEHDKETKERKTSSLDYDLTFDKPDLCKIEEDGYDKDDYETVHCDSLSASCLQKGVNKRSKKAGKYNCEFCGIGFKRKDYFFQHLLTLKFNFESKSKKKEECVESSDKLRLHDNHCNETSFKSNKCCKGFKQRLQLVKHLKMHNKERRFKCDVCGKRFKAGCDLKKHTRIHTGETPYECTICGKKYAWSNQLTVHMRVHTRDKPYLCNVCGKRFSCSGNLVTHKRTHTGETPYKCKECGKEFNQTSNLKTHMLRHLNLKPYKCDM